MSKTFGKWEFREPTTVTVIARPFGGKDTQMGFLKDALPLQLFATGDAIRKRSARDHEFASLIQSFGERMIDDDIMMPMVKDGVCHIPSDSSILLNGVPRRVEQIPRINQIISLQRGMTSSNKLVWFINVNLDVCEYRVKNNPRTDRELLQSYTLRMWNFYGRQHEYEQETAPMISELVKSGWNLIETNVDDPKTQPEVVFENFFWQIKSQLQQVIPLEVVEAKAPKIAALAGAV